MRDISADRRDVNHGSGMRWARNEHLRRGPQEATPVLLPTGNTKATLMLCLTHYAGVASMGSSPGRRSKKCFLVRWIKSGKSTGGFFQRLLRPAALAFAPGRWEHRYPRDPWAAAHGVMYSTYHSTWSGKFGGAGRGGPLFASGRLVGMGLPLSPEAGASTSVETILSSRFRGRRAREFAPFSLDGPPAAQVRTTRPGPRSSVRSARRFHRHPQHPLATPFGISRGFSQQSSQC